MGGLLHLFNFHHGYMRRKHKKQDAHLEAPRNSLQLPTETWENHYAARDSEEDLSDMSCYPNDASMKKLMNEQIPKRSNDRQNAPSIVARLMGMDPLPVEAKPEACPLEDEKESIEMITDKEVQNVEKVSAVRAPKKSNSSSKKHFRSYKDVYFRYWRSASNLRKAVQPRIHPQEKELQKFKEDFEAWQAARFVECARVVELSNIPEQWLAQLDLTKEKMALYETSRRALIEKSMGHKTDLSLKSRSLHGGDFQKREMSPVGHKGSRSYSGRSLNVDIERLSLKDSDMISDKSSTHARIVVLRPGPDSFTTNDESWVSSCSMEDRDSIEDLLEEVKRRLRSEMQGKTFRKGYMVRGGGIETPFKEKPVYMNQTGQPSTKQVKENASVDLERTLARSESPRSYQSGIQVNELDPSSPRFVSRDTGKFLSERLKNVLNVGGQQNIPDVSGDVSMVTPFDDARERLETARDSLNSESGRKYWQDMNYEADLQARSSRHEIGDYGIFQETSSPRNLIRSLSAPSSPRNLIRSLSAPTSGTSFGKFLLEDRFISTGAHIKRKHETLESLSPNFKGQMKERSNFREKVSTIKHSLSLRKQLFDKKFQSIGVSQTDELDSNDIMSGPTILTSFNEGSENLSEVPPSPASICSSAHEELWKPTDNPSPIDSDVTSLGDQSVGNVFREISSNLTELRKQLDQLEYEGSEITTISEDPSESEVIDWEDEAEAYIKNLLTTSGLYDGTWENSFSRWDPYMKPLSNWVFEEVEESYRKPTNEIDEEEEENSYDDTNWEHKLLFDLLNEALSVILGPPRTLSKFRRNITDMTTLPLPQGRMLLDRVWEVIREYAYPSMDTDSYSLDDFVAHELNIMPWSNLIDEDTRDLGKELQNLIIGELVEELVMDIQQL